MTGAATCITGTTALRLENSRERACAQDIELPVHYYAPMPDYSRVSGRNVEELVLNGAVLSTVRNGRPKRGCTRSTWRGWASALPSCILKKLS